MAKGGFANQICDARTRARSQPGERDAKAIEVYRERFPEGESFLQLSLN